jgi:hypothetical protein
MIDDLSTEEEVKRILFAVAWYGPWERLEGFFFGVRKDGTLRWDIRDDGSDSFLLALLGRLGAWASYRDCAWRHRYVEQGIKPWFVWRRGR